MNPVFRAMLRVFLDHRTLEQVCVAATQFPGSARQRAAEAARDIRMAESLNGRYSIVLWGEATAREVSA